MEEGTSGTKSIGSNFDSNLFEGLNLVLRIMVQIAPTPATQDATTIIAIKVPCPIPPLEEDEEDFLSESAEAEDELDAESEEDSWSEVREAEGVTMETMVDLAFVEREEAGMEEGLVDAGGAGAEEDEGATELAGELLATLAAFGEVDVSGSFVVCSVVTGEDVEGDD